MQKNTNWLWIILGVSLVIVVSTVSSDNKSDKKKNTSYVIEQEMQYADGKVHSSGSRIDKAKNKKLEEETIEASAENRDDETEYSYSDFDDEQELVQEEENTENVKVEAERTANPAGYYGSTKRGSSDNTSVKKEMAKAVVQNIDQQALANVIVATGANITQYKIAKSKAFAEAGVQVAKNVIKNNANKATVDTTPDAGKKDDKTDKPGTGNLPDKDQITDKIDQIKPDKPNQDDKDNKNDNNNKDDKNDTDGKPEQGNKPGVGDIFDKIDQNKPDQDQPENPDSEKNSEDAQGQ